MSLSLLGIAIVCSLVAAALTRFAGALYVLDRPNHRSSHSSPIARGGGIAIVAVSVTALMVFWLAGIVEARFALALLIGGLAVAGIGFVDDRRPVPRWVRLTVHIGAASCAVYLLDDAPKLQLGDRILVLDGVWALFSILAVTWVLNLFNFMDGIDGIAAAEAVFVAVAGAALGAVSGVSAGLPHSAAALGGAALGFLLWNWPPAKVFMGDVGSGYLGFMIAVLALFAAAQNPVMIWVWLGLGGVFFIDATYTLLRRLARGERVYEAHRSHIYQELAIRWEGHRPVTLAIIGINLVFLLPVALGCILWPQLAGYLVTGALLILLALAIWANGERDATGKPAAESEER